MGVMPLPYYEVDVPIRNTARPSLLGLHVLTGQAGSRCDAVRIAHEVYDAALAAQAAGLEPPGKHPGGWGARGIRPGWEPDWSAATVGRWNDPYSWTHVSSTEP
ncbi:hypothetical protein [Streptomyces triculaminicus]|uniref:hypothetical protein n=1 Tax=Streptomyces triculaminicus TaxID=2816232 RepID=UPI0037D9284B